jgi:hypothetical protein
MKLILAGMLLYGSVAYAERAPDIIIADTMRLQTTYKQCLADQTVKLGVGNSESADTILRAASATCFQVEQDLRSVYAESPLGQAYVDRLMARDRKLGEDAGVAALLAARAR